MVMCLHAQVAVDVVGVTLELAEIELAVVMKTDCFTPLVLAN